MDCDEQFRLCWDNHQSTLSTAFTSFFTNNRLVDCTLAAEGKFLMAHKVVLSACSPYFETLLSQQYDKHPIFILKDIKFRELQIMMDYMYKGEVDISEDELADLVKVAESLQIKGLTRNRGESTENNDSIVKTEPVVSKSGLTMENEQPSNKQSSVAESNISMTHAGLSSRTSPKRKFRLPNMDNHDPLFNTSNHTHVDKVTKASAQCRKQDQNVFDVKGENFNRGGKSSSEGLVRQNQDDVATRNRPHYYAQGYNIVAKFGESKYGNIILLHNGYKFMKLKTRLNSIDWGCTHTNRGCKARAATTKLNGRTMMKLTQSLHTH